MTRTIKFPLFFSIASIVMFIVLILIVLSGNNVVLSYLTLFTGPVAAFTVGTIGLKLHTKGGGIIGSDQFSAMNSFFALGTIVLSLSEIITSIVWMLPDKSNYYSIILILQFPGLLLWSLGTTSYFHACIEALGCYDVKKAMLSVVIISVTFVVALSQVRDTYIVGILSGFPSMVALMITTLTLGWLLWTFKGGRLRQPLGLFFLAVLVFLIQSMSLYVFDMLPIDSLERALTVESYLLLGVALALPQNV